MKKTLNRAPNFLLFALRGSIAGAAIGFVAGLCVAALVLFGRGLAGDPIFGFGVPAGLFWIGFSTIGGGAAGIVPGGVAGFCGALAFEFFRSRAAIVIYAVVAAVITIYQFNFGFRDAALYLVFVFACGGGFVFANVLQRLWRSVKAQEERFAAQLEERD